MSTFEYIKAWLVEATLMESKSIYYHGTTTYFLKDILHKGLIYKRENCNHLGCPAHEGIYLTIDAESALRYSELTKTRFPGNTLIVITRLETRTGVPDEDELPNIYSHVMASLAGKNRTTIDIEAMAKEIANEYIARLNLGIDSSEAIMSGMDIEKIKGLVIEYVTYLIQADIDRFNGKRKGVDTLSPEVRAYIDKLSRSLSQLTANLVRVGRLENIRILNQIGFSGANKIIGIHEIKGARFGEQKIATVNHYGELTQDLLDLIVKYKTREKLHSNYHRPRNTLKTLPIKAIPD